MKPIIGIDLGTTFSAIAVLDESGTANIIPVDGERIIASCISAPSTEPGKIFVGNQARNDLSTEPQNVIQHFKRDMGEAKTDQLQSGPKFTPSEASAQVLKKLIQEAEKEVGKITEVVITVPANFAERQRAATIAAGKKAGVKVKNIINEPTAAALTLATKQKINGTILIYDLGGGTFDVTIAKVQGQEVTCLTSEGDFHLGGIDFDLALANLANEAHRTEHGRSLREALHINSVEDEKNSPEWQELLQECEEIKKGLSNRTSVTLRFRSSPSGPFTMTITREEFVSQIVNFISKTEMLVETALDNVDMTPSEIDTILLVGGSTRIPAIKDSLRGLFGKEPTESVNPDEAVAVGAAIYSGLKVGSENLNPLQQEKLSKVSIKDVANHYYGTTAYSFDSELQKDELRVSILIEKDTPLPCSITEEFQTRVAGQRYLNCDVTQSAQKELDPKWVDTIHKEDLGPLPEGRPKGQPLEYTYSYDVDQTMHCTFHDVNSGLKLEVDLHPDDSIQPSSDDLDLNDLIIE
jgi:molecular chaperone DnaK